MIAEPTFKVAHQAVSHVLVEILNTLRKLVSAQVLKQKEVRSSRSTDQIKKTRLLTFVLLRLSLMSYKTFLLDILTMKARHCLWISRPGFWRFFKKSTKSLVTWSVSKLAWRLMDGLGVLPSWVSDEEEPHL